MEEYLESEEAKLNENILSMRVKNRSKYMLIETLDLLEANQLLKESFIGKQIHKYLTLALMMLFDDMTGELSGLVAVIPLLYKNVYELSQTNKAVEAELAKSPPDKKALKDLFKMLFFLKLTDSNPVTMELEDLARTSTKTITPESLKIKSISSL